MTTQLPDFVVSAISANPTSGNAGSTATVNVTVTNNGPGSGAASLCRLRLASSTTITTSDPLLDEFTVGALSAGQSLSFSRTVTIPAGTATGARYMGATANANSAVTESTTGQNNNQNTTAFTVTAVTLLPDFVVSAISANPTSGNADSTATVSVTVTNNGAGSGAASLCRIRLASSTTITTSDPLLDEFTVGALTAGQSLSFSRTVTIPAGTAAGARYMGATANANSAVTESATGQNNNQNTAAFTVTAVTLLPDFVVSAISANPTSGNAGSTATVNVTVTNNGPGSGAASLCRIRLASSTTITTSDPLLDEFTVGALSAGQSLSFSRAVTIPAGTAAGARYMGATANANSAVAESATGQNNNQNTTSFTVILAGPSADSYEADDAPGSAKTILNGQTQNRSIHAAGNADWATFTVGGNGATNVVVETAGASGDTEVWLYGPNSSSTLVAYNDDGNGLFSRISLTSLAAGTYYIKVQTYGNNATIAAYTLRAAWTDGTNPVSDGNDTAATATAAANGQTANAAITPVGDTDWYRITVGSSGATNAVIETNGASGDTVMWLYGPNSSSTQVAYNDDGNGLFSRVSLASLAAGTYYVKVQAYGNNSTIPAYTLRASWTDGAAPPSDGNDTSATATAANNNQTVNAAITPAGDTDWYSFTVGSNGATNAVIETNGANGDTVMWLYGPNSSSTQIDYNDDGNGMFSRISRASLGAGTYYVKVQAYGNNTAIPAYTLRAAWTDGAPPVSDGNDTSATATLATNGQTVNAAITPTGDTDWYRFAVGSNGATSAVIETAGPSGDTVMWLYGPNSPTALVAYNDDGNGSFSRITLPSLAAGTYYVKVQAYANNSTIRAYTLRAAWTDGSPPTSLTSGLAQTSLSGAARSMTYFSVEVPAGQTGLDVNLWNGTGDADIFVGQGSLPTTSASWRSSAQPGNTERISIPTATPGTYYILIYGTSSYSNATLRVFAGNAPRVVLLLHGMNTNPGDTWGTLMQAISGSDNAHYGTYMGKIFNGLLVGNVPQPAGGIYYYALDFGALDWSSGHSGLDVNSGGNALSGENTVRENYAPNGRTELAHDLDGDYCDFNQLGVEILVAVQAIKQQHGQNVRIALVAHSRGGLAARAFLQSTTPAATAAKTAIEGVLTLGTPHLGSRFGRFYEYLRTHPRNDPNPTNSTNNNTDWNFADGISNESVFGSYGVNVGEPTVKFLSDESAEMSVLNAAVNQIPAGIRLGALRFSGRLFGNLNQVGDIFDGQRAWVGFYIYDPSDGAKNDILRGTTQDALTGDGIVPETSQLLWNLPAWNGRQLLDRTASTGIFHTDETKQTYSIELTMHALFGWW